MAMYRVAVRIPDGPVPLILRGCTFLFASTGDGTAAEVAAMLADACRDAARHVPT